MLRAFVPKPTEKAMFSQELQIIWNCLKDLYFRPMNLFFKVQFHYCPAIWMIHSRTLNNKINRLHERCLRIIYNDIL